MFRLEEVSTIVALSDTDISQYCSVMEEIKRRTDVIQFFLNRDGHALFEATTTESICLQVRKILELVALASLIANKEKYGQAYRNIEKHWNAERILRDLRRINPEFYPNSIIEVALEGPVVARWDDRTTGFLTEDDFVDIYEKCGSILHARNPLRDPIDYEAYLRNIPDWIDKIMKLLNSHTIRLADDPNLYLIQMKGQEGHVRGYTFAPTDPPDGFDPPRTA